MGGDIANIADLEFLSNVNDCPSTPTMAMPNVPTMAIPNMPTTTIPIVPTTVISNDDVVAEPNIHEAIEEDGDRTHMDIVQLPTFHIHPCLHDVHPPQLLAPSQQPL